MSSTPVPSHLIFLQDLASTEEGIKVRFLGFIESYDIPTSTLRLRHNLSDAEPAAPSVTAHVELSLLAETLSSDTTAKGTWVNVIGYVISTSEASSEDYGRVKTRSKSKSKAKGESVIANVQALMLWPAGAIDVNAYEEAVRGRKEVAQVDRAVAETES